MERSRENQRYNKGTCTPCVLHIAALFHLVYRFPRFSTGLQPYAVLVSHARLNLDHAELDRTSSLNGALDANDFLWPTRWLELFALETQHIREGRKVSALGAMGCSNRMMSVRFNIGARTKVSGGKRYSCSQGKHDK